MSQADNKHKKESKLWLVGMVGVIIAVILLVAAAILIQHQQLSLEATAYYSAK